MSNAGDQEPSKRVRITSPRRAAARRSPTRPATTEIDEQTGLGKVYMAALLRAQLRLTVSVLVAVAAGLGVLPLLFLVVPAIHELRVWLIPLPWIILGVLVYPVVALAALYYVRHAEAIERDFADLVDRR
ncbi:MAG TPA: hypothetical protein VIL87_07390 [Dermatophilaceae bacterium]|jgi:ABC-type enterochelin transport system permease subunit